MNAVEIVSGLDAIARLAPVWAEADAHAGVGAFERFDLVVGAARLAERNGAAPLVAIVRNEAGPSLLALRRERLFGARALVPLVYPLAQYTDAAGAALEPGGFNALCDALSREGADVILWRKVREDSRLHAALSQHARSQRARDSAPYIDLAAFGTLSAYEASFSSRTRRNRRQRMQRLAAQEGALSFEVLSGAEAAAAFDAAVAWKRAWLSERAVSSLVFNSPDWAALLRETVCSGSAIVTALKAGSSLVAVEIGFADGPNYIAYLGAFDERLAAFSPGQEQMLRTIGWCFEQGFARYDLLAPGDDYKRHWTRTDTSVAVDDHAIALTHVGRGVAGLRRRVRPLAREVYYRLSPEIRAAGGRYGMPAATMAAAAAAAGALIAALE